MAAARPSHGQLLAPQHRPRTVVGVLPDGTVFYVPRGTVWTGPAGACCHLCGFWFPDLVPHLGTGHGWTRERYVAAFGLDRGVRLAAVAGPRVAAGSPAAAVPPAARQPGCGGPLRGGGARRGAPCRGEDVRRTASGVTARFGAAGLGELVGEAVRSGLSLAELSRRAGLPDRWLDRHLADLSPSTAAWVASVRRGEAPLGRSVAQRWLVGVAALGFAHPADYLRARRTDGWSWERIAYEGGVSRSWLIERRDRIEALFDPVLGAGTVPHAPHTP